MPNNYLVVLAVERPNEQKSQLLTCVRTSVLLPYFPFIELNIFNFPPHKYMVIIWYIEVCATSKITVIPY